jgi:serine/threonine-protein kinase
MRPGDKIAGKLRLVRRVGFGGMGAVWAARNEATDADVALKVLRPDKDVNNEVVARFRHEAKLGAMLAHRSITRVFDLIEEPDGSLILVMELLRGETLEAYYKKKGSIPNEEAIAIITPILSALQHAHDHGVVHRDIKPQNIFLHVDPDGQVTPKLLDFGIAKAEDANIHTLLGRVLGTPAYMSPEQIRASREIDGRSDLFSIGVVLYEAISGTCPFDASAPSAALAQVLEAPVDPDPKIDPRVWLELQRAMAKQPYERHASADELSRALCSAIGKSEAELVTSLRRSKPPPVPEGEEDPSLFGPPTMAPHNETLSEGGQSMAQSAPVRRRGWVSWAAAGGVAVTIALLAAVGIRSATKPSGAQPTLSDAPAASATAAAPSSAATAPATTVANFEIVTPTATPPSTTPPSRPTSKAHPHPTAKPHPSGASSMKPVATTPGF